MTAPNMDQRKTLAQVEREMILDAVRRLGGVGAAKELGIGKTTIYRRLKEYGADTDGKPEEPCR